MCIPMKRNRLAAVLLSVSVLLSCSFLPALAAETPGSEIVISRVSGRLEHSFPANIVTPISSTVSLGKGETITYDCTYTPRYSSLDFGYLDSENVFHYQNFTNGIVDTSIEISQRGQYRLAIRNNENYAVAISGTVKY